MTEVPETDLRQALQVHLRCKPASSPEDKHASAVILTILQRMPEFKNWMDLVEEKYQSQVEGVLKAIAPDMKQIQIPEPEHEVLPPPSLYFDRKIPVLTDMFKTDLERGLNSSDVERLRAYYGTNELPKPPRPSIFLMLLGQVTDFMVRQVPRRCVLPA